jgi:hypothetical protein
MRRGIKHIYTKHGDMYAGAEWNEIGFENYTILIQFSKIQDYKKLNHSEKTIEKINEYGWVIANEAIAGTIEDENFNPQSKHHESESWYGDFERKIMFVFGAGASANCVCGDGKAEFEKDILRPPLGPSLFDRRFKNYYSRYKGVKQSLNFLQGDNPDVEEMFEREWKNIAQDSNEAVMLRHINIQFYLQELLRDVSNRVTEEYYANNLYAKLTNQLQKIYAASVKNIYGRRSVKKFAFISFNQDTILENFLHEQFRKPLTTLDDYVNINASPFCVFKPHGSWNWGWKFPDTSKFGGKTADWLFDNNINYFQLYFQILGDHVNMIDWNTWGYETAMSKHHLGKHTIDKSQIKIISNNDLSNYYPALLLPYRDKDEFIMPLRHFNNMRHYFSNIETLIVIGWKGNEAAFNRLLFQHAHKIRKVVIADPNPEIVEENLKQILSRQNVEKVVYDNFQEFVDNGIEKEIEYANAEKTHS